MKTLLRLFVVFLFLAFGSLQAASPNVKVTKKSIFANTPFGQFPTLPHAALNTATGESLVIWENGAKPGDPGPAGITLYGKIISSQGKSTSKKIPYIHSDVEQNLDVAYNPVTNEYLLVFDRQCCIKNVPFPNDSIHALRLDSHLKAIGKEFEIIATTDKDRMTSPQVVFNPQTNGYTLIWEIWDRSESTGTADSGIAAVQLNQSGKIIGKRISIAKNPGKSGFYDDVCCGRVLDFIALPSGNKFLILFQQRFSSDRVDYFLATVDSMLEKVKLSRFASYTISADSGPNYPKRGGSLVTLQDGSALVFYSADNGVKRRTIDSKGKLSRNDSFAFSTPLDTEALVDPDVAFSTTAGGTFGLLTAYAASNDVTYWAQVLDSKGLPLGKPVTMYQYTLDARGEPVPWGSALMTLPRNASDRQFEFVWLQALASNQQSQSNIIKLNLEIQP